MKYHPQTYKAYELFHNGILALSRAEQQGLRIDLDYSENKKQELTKKILEMEKELRQTNFYKHWKHSCNNNDPNINSNTQLAHFLYKVKKIDPKITTESGQGSTDEEALQQLNIPELNQLLQIRKLKKMRDTYLDAFVREQVDEYIHPFFNLHLVRTFRSSSDKPNFQNIPKRDTEAMQICRNAILPRPGHQFLEVDYSGIEVRIAACYHNDPVMIKYITDPTSDMHLDMASQIFLLNKPDKKIPEIKYLRAATKNGFVFPEFYGDYYKNCAYNIACKWGKLPEGSWKKGQGVAMPEGFLSDHLIKNKITSFQDFTEHIKKIENDFWNNRFKIYQKWKDKWWREYQKNGYVDLFTGFRCKGVMSKNDSINYPIQGSAFHCLLWSFIRLDEIIIKENWKSRLVGQIHDAILFDVHPKELTSLAKVIKRVTCEELPKNWKWINVPLEVEMEVSEVDRSWAELKSYCF